MVLCVLYCLLSDYQCGAVYYVAIESIVQYRRVIEIVTQAHCFVKYPTTVRYSTLNQQRMQQRISSKNRAINEEKRVYTLLLCWCKSMYMNC